MASPYAIKQSFKHLSAELCN